MKQITKYKLIALQAFIAAFLMVGCNSDYLSLLKDEYDDVADRQEQRAKKVLYIIVDGMNGDVVKSVQPTFITQMSENSLYSYESLVDAEFYESNEYSSWVTLLTGKNPSKHKVKEDNTIPDFEVHPTLMQLLTKRENALYTSSADFETTFAGLANKSVLGATDEELMETLIPNLENVNSDFIIAHLTEVDRVGQNSGYTDQSAEYEEAIITVDDRVQEMVQAIQAREKYKKEDWLIVLTSSRGEMYGTANAFETNHFLEPEKNNLIVFYNPKFSSRYYARPGTEIPFNRGVLHMKMGSGSDIPEPTLKDEDLFNMSFANAGDGYTVQFKFKYGGNGGSSWPYIIRKGTESNPSGFGMFSNSNGGGFQYWYAGSGKILVGSGDFGYNDWRTLTWTFEKVGTANQVRSKIYIDNNLVADDTRSATSISQSAPLKIGNRAGVNGSPEMSFSQLIFLEKALTETEVQNSYCQTEVEVGHPGHGYERGIWRFDEMTGTLIHNSLNDEVNESFEFTGNANWTQMNEYIEVFCPPITDSYFKVVPTGADVPLTIMQWFGESYTTYKDFDGRAWSFGNQSLTQD